MVWSRHGKASDFRVKELDMAPFLAEASCVRGPHGPPGYVRKDATAEAE